MSLASLIRLIINAVVGGVFLYMSEVVDASYRGISVTVSVMIGRLGGLIAPMFVTVL